MPKSDGYFKKDHNIWYKKKKMPHPRLGKHCSEETKKILRENHKGKHYSINTEFKKGHKNWNLGLKGKYPKELIEKFKITNKENYLKSWKKILEESENLKKQGFRVVPLTKVIPDIIALKNGKIFAIEVEYGNPDYGKYTEDIRVLFDDIIWIIKKRR